MEYDASTLQQLGVFKRHSETARKAAFGNQVTDRRSTPTATLSHGRQWQLRRLSNFGESVLKLDI